MKKLALLLALLIACLNFAACERKCQCVEVDGPEDGPGTPDQVPSDVSNEETPDIEIAPDRYIDIKVSDYYGAIYEDKDEIRLIKDRGELEKFFMLSGIAVTDAYDDEFFKEKALVFVLATRGSGSIKLGIKHACIKGGILEVTLTNHIPEFGTDDMQYSAFAIEINQKDVKGVDTARLINETIFSTTLWDKVDCEKNAVDFTLYNYYGTVESTDTRIMYGNYGWPEIITDRHELDAFMESYVTYGEDIGMGRFVNTDMEDNFFDEKAIIVIPEYTIEGDYPVYHLVSICVNGEMNLYLQEQEYTIFGDGIQMVVVDKDSLPHDNKFNLYFDRIEDLYD